MVEVFKTNVSCTDIAKGIIADLLRILPDSIINFDLEDCDRILRIESKHIIPETIVNTVNKRGFICEILD